MTLRLRNTLTRRVEDVEPLEPGRVRMYTCGPTVYRYAHVGNLRSNLLADLIRRTLLYHGIDVFQVKNITDVGHLRDEGFDRGADPMLVAAGLEHKTPGEIADAYEAAFHADEALLSELERGDDYFTAFRRVSIAAPTISVDTTDGYRPGLDEIVAFIASR